MLAAVCPRYGPPDVLRVQDVPMPQPGRGRIRVRVRAAAVTSTDCRIRAMAFPPAVQVPARLALGLRGPRRRVLGMAFAGEIDAIGPVVHEWRVGDRVVGLDRYRFGAHGQYLCTSATGVLAPIPAEMSFRDAAALPYGGLLALWFLDRAGITTSGPPTRPAVLVYGASGAVGTAAVQLAVHAGARVTAACSAANTALVTSLGATDVVDYTRADLTARPQINPAAGPLDAVDRFDVVFIAVGDRVGPPSADDCRAILAPHGRYVAVDHGRPRLAPDLLTRLCGLVERRAFQPVVDRSWPLQDIAAAHRYVDAGHARGAVIVELP